MIRGKGTNHARLSECSQGEDEFDTATKPENPLLAIPRGEIVSLSLLK